MESSVARAGATRRRTGSVRATQAGLLIASLGAILVIFHPFDLGVVGIFLAIGGAVLAAPGGIGQGWFYAVAGGTVLVAVSRLVAESAEVLGGWLAVIGGVAIMIGAILGFPAREDRR
jgi:hypothetical protein